MSQSGYISNFQNVLENRQFSTVNVPNASSGSGGSGKKITFNEISRFIQRLGAGLEAASAYNYGSVPVPRYQGPASTVPANYTASKSNTQAALPWILGITVTGIAVAVLIKNQS